MSSLADLGLDEFQEEEPAQAEKAGHNTVQPILPKNTSARRAWEELAVPAWGEDSWASYLKDTDPDGNWVQCSCGAFRKCGGGYKFKYFRLWTN